MLIISNLYANAITSLVTAKTPPAAYDKIDDILRDDYQIIWDGSQKIAVTLEDIYGATWTQRRIGTEIKKAFRHVTNNHLIPDWVKLLQERGIMLLASLNEETFVPITRKTIDANSNKKYGCKFVQERLHTMFVYWQMHTMNMEWLLETIERIHQSGLRERIYQWSDWAFNLHSGSLQFTDYSLNRPQPRPDIIILQKLFIPIATCVAIVVISLIVFAFELRINGRNQTSCQVVSPIKSGMQILVKSCKDLKTWVVKVIHVRRRPLRFAWADRVRN